MKIFLKKIIYILRESIEIDFKRAGNRERNQK
jgi:hypothetical protein